MSEQCVRYGIFFTCERELVLDEKKHKKWSTLRPQLQLYAMNEYHKAGRRQCVFACVELLHESSSQSHTHSHTGNGCVPQQAHLLRRYPARLCVRQTARDVCVRSSLKWQCWHAWTPTPSHLEIRPARQWQQSRMQ